MFCTRVLHTLEKDLRSRLVISSDIIVFVIFIIEKAIAKNFIGQKKRCFPFIYYLLLLSSLWFFSPGNKRVHFEEREKEQAERFKGKKCVSVKQMQEIVTRLSHCDPSQVPDSGKSKFRGKYANDIDHDMNM